MLKVTRPRFRPRFPDRSFAPGLLFGSGIQGVWYDPSDFSTMFQDVAGTTPVTAVEQTVALLIDRSGNGNNATQSVVGSRPTLRARYNLLTFSEQFDNGAWTKTALNTTGTPAYVNVAVAPDGTTTADKLIANTTLAQHFFRQNIATTAISYTMSVYAKAAEYSGLWMSMDGGSNYGLFTLSGAGSTSTTTGTSTITSVGNGWYRCTFTFTRAAGTAALFFGAANPAGTLVFAGDNSSGILLWGAQFITASDVTATGNAYQRIAAATDYDTSNPVFRPYLAFDGTDDSMLTNSINFSATNAMTVLAGLTKLSDSAQRVVAELSATIASNNGSFLLSAPNSAAANYNFSSKGTTQVDNTITTYTAPNTAVLTGQADIGAPSNIIRVNGAQAGSVATTQGTGNYGNYALFVGRRNNATLPFSGRLYGLIVRGAASTPTQIADTEAWMNAKTGAF